MQISVPHLGPFMTEARLRRICARAVAADLVLAGHTHGGHVGLVSLGLDWTAVRALTGIPDHGAWGQRDNRLYVHRTNGHYGFPLRIGVPAEESVLELVWSAPPVSA